MLGVECEYLTGVLTSFIGPQAGCSTSTIISRARTARTLVSTQNRNKMHNAEI